MMKITSGEHGCGNSALIADQVFMSASVNSVPKLASSALSHPNRAQQCRQTRKLPRAPSWPGAPRHRLVSN